jgi:hypothetical protein
VFCGDQPQNPDKNLAPAGFFVFWVHPLTNWPIAIMATDAAGMQYAFNLMKHFGCGNQFPHTGGNHRKEPLPTPAALKSDAG